MFSFFKKLFEKGNEEKIINLIKQGAFLVDVRSPREFAGGSVKGAVNIPLDNIQNEISKFKSKENIIVFCRSGTRSSQAKSYLEQKGFTNVTNGGTWNNVNRFVTN